MYVVPAFQSTLTAISVSRQHKNTPADGLENVSLTGFTTYLCIASVGSNTTFSHYPELPQSCGEDAAAGGLRRNSVHRCKLPAGVNQTRERNPQGRGRHPAGHGVVVQADHRPGTDSAGHFLHDLSLRHTRLKVGGHRVPQKHPLLVSPAPAHHRRRDAAERWPHPARRFSQ